MSTQPYFRTPSIDPDGSQIAFVYAGDIWLVAASGGRAERLTAHAASHKNPRFSPDGASLAFTADRNGNGEIYVLPLDGGAVRQLTFHDGRSTVEAWARDGQAIYFTANREQIGDSIYRIKLTGGTPALIYSEPYENLGAVSIDPMGRRLAFCNIRDRWWRRGPDPFSPGEIWLGPSAETDAWKTGNYTALQLLAGPQPTGPATQPVIGIPGAYAGRNAWPLWAPDGAGLYFVSDRDGVENLWYLALDGTEPQRITTFEDGRLLFPQIALNAGLIVFERNFQIWHLDLATREAAPLTITARGDSKVTPVREESWTRHFSELRLSPDGKKIAFIARGQVFVDFADKETERDVRQGPSFRVTDTRARERQVAWTPDSRSLIYLSDRHGEDEIYRYDVVVRKETRLTTDLTPKAMPRISPDGKWIAYLSQTEAVRLVSLNGEEARELCRARFVVSADLCWSPDSRWLAYLAQDEHFFSNSYVVSLEGGEPRQITFLSNLGGSNLLWSPNGQHLIFTTRQYRAEAQIVCVDLRPQSPLFREAEFEKLFEEKDKEPPKEEYKRPIEKIAVEFDPPTEPEDPDETPETTAPPQFPADRDPVTRTETAVQAMSTSSTEKPEAIPMIVFEGIERRLHFLTPIQMDASAAVISPDSRDLLLLAVVADKVNIWSMPLDEPRRGHPPRQLTASESSKAAVQFTPDGRAFFVLEDGTITIRKFPAGNEPVKVHVRGDVTVDFHRDKQQIFHEAWRALRDNFYDPTFRGQDWALLRERFAPLIEGAQTTDELHTLINLMTGELRASHLGSSPGRWMGSDGYLGVLFDPVELTTSGRLRVQRLIPDSPVAMGPEPPRPGEYLVAINGTSLTTETSLDRLMRRSVGRRIRLTLAEDPDHDGPTREVDLRPLNGYDYAYLRYRDWVISNEAYVHRISGGRLGYVHIERMSYDAYQQFLADLDAEAHGKEGVVIDVRYNSGGHTATFILDLLTRRTVVLSSFRQQATIDAAHMSGNRILNKPTVLVTNEHSASNTEMLSESYRRLGLGKIVGRPTAGAVIWTHNIRLLDGAFFRLPSFAVLTPEGEHLEGHGRPVDVDVTRPLGEWAIGRDRQLDAAVAVLLGENW